MIKKCPICKEGKIDYSMSEIYLIPDTKPKEAGLEGLCSKCSAHYYFQFKLYQVEITVFNDYMEEKYKKIIKNI